MSLSRTNKIVRSLQFLFCFALISTSSIYAGFIDTGQGARPIGLGRAYTSVANDVHAVFYNPAGLAQLKSFGISTMYARLYPGIESENLHYEMIVSAIPIKYLGRIGVGLTNLNFDIYQENMLYLSYGRQLPFNLSIGGNVKFMRWSAEGDVDPISNIQDQDYSFNGISFDAALLYRVSFGLIDKYLKKGHLQLGMMIRDVTEPGIATNGSANAKLPRGLAAGLAYVSEDLVLSGELSRRDEFTKLHLGAEYVFQKLTFRNINSAFILRGGTIQMLNDTEGGEVDAGFGVLLTNIQFDYVYVYPLALKEVGGSHKMSLSFHF